VHLGWVGGKRRRKVVYGKTRAEVNQKVTRLLAEQQKGLPIQTASITVAAFLEQWMEQVVIPTTTPGTAGTYRSIIDKHLVPAIGTHKLDKLSQQHVQAMLNAKLAAGLSPAMVGQIRIVLRAAISQAMRWDLVGRNVVALTTPPKGAKFDGYGVSPDEVRAIMTTVQNDDLEALYAIATSVGLRMGELLGLTWADVDLEAAQIAVRHQLQVIDGVPQLVALKSRHSRRSVPIDPILAIVRGHRTRQIARRLADGVAWSEDGFVFAWPAGTPVSDSYLRKHWHQVRAAAGLPDRVRFHDLRHGALTILAARGTAPRTLMGIAGHATIATTMDVYAHLDADSARASVELMRDLYGPQEGVS
jgi:integrase